MSEIETDRVRGCKREKERQDGEERKRRDEEKKKVVEAVQMVCMYVRYWYVLVRYGAVRYGGGMV